MTEENRSNVKKKFVHKSRCRAYCWPLKDSQTMESAAMPGHAVDPIAFGPRDTLLSLLSGATVLEPNMGGYRAADPNALIGWFFSFWFSVPTIKKATTDRTKVNACHRR